MRAALLAAGVFVAGMMPASGLHAQPGGYSLNWSAISGSGIVHMRSACYILSGSIDFQSAPNNVSIFYGTGGYTLYSGIWWAAPISNLDEIFFDGFEGCK